MAIDGVRFAHDLQVLLGHPGDQDAEGNELPRLFYVSREKKPGFQHHRKAGALNALVRVSVLERCGPASEYLFFSCNLQCLFCLVYWQLRVSALLTNGAYVLNLDYDHCVTNSGALREAMCFLMDPVVGNRTCFVQFPLRVGGYDDGGGGDELAS